MAIMTEATYNRRRSIVDQYAERKIKEKVITAPSIVPLIIFGSFLVLDANVAFVYLASAFSGLETSITFKNYSFYDSLLDILYLSILRIITASVPIIGSYVQGKPPPPSPFNPYHPNGDKKSKTELEEEALEEPFWPWLVRFVTRSSFPCEVLSVASIILAVVKCLIRMDVEIGVYGDKMPHHFFWWFYVAVVAICATIDVIYVETMIELAGKYGRYVKRRRPRRTFSSISLQVLGRNESNNSLLSPFLESDDNMSDLESAAFTTAESDTSIGGSEQGDNIRGRSDISSDADYKASSADLFSLLCEDTHLIAAAFIFLLGAATAQIYIPQFTGNILDALTENAGNNKHANGTDIWNVPGFMSNTKKLVVAAILCGIFSGIRGAIFTAIGGRVNVRIRMLLMDSLLSQDIGFFDTTKTGDITSRLSSDTTLVGDQVTLNINVFLRSCVQAIGVLIFMFMLSWKLSVLAFISVPVITILSKWYGNYIKNLTKLMQKKLADGNSISEAALGAMPTVRAFGAETAELNEFGKIMKIYLKLQTKSAFAYFGYCAAVTSFPQLVTALVLFYGGILVQSEGEDHISGGQLVSFLLYLTSLSDAFNSIGNIFASITQAVGAADKVFELIYREPRVLRPSCSDDIHDNFQRGKLNTISSRTHSLRTDGLKPSQCVGEVTLNNVEMYYPARPTRRILDCINMRAPPGAVVALVGPSGGGKSSIISLIQHLYEPTNGRVCIDNNEIHDLSPQWLSRNVSVVSQEPTLFARSIRRNIIYGLEGTEFEPSMEEVKEAARLANASDFIESLPGGYDTDVGERGVQLSGGQKQRIAIARALVRKPRILLLDEATSALDAESEASVQEAIDGMLRRGRAKIGKDEGNAQTMTVIVVAHRLSTVRNADIILVIEKGRVIEQGCHDELVKIGDGAYTNLVERQMQAQKKLDKR